MTYFRKVHWEASWIETARDMLREEWNKFYKPLIDPSFLDQPSTNTSPVSVILVRY